jgi:5-methylcytosine-specific restriction protein B
MLNIEEYITRFIAFSNIQVTGNGVKDLKVFTKDFIKDYRGLNVQFSVGKGRATNIPWVSFLGKNQETQNGIYPVFLYYKDINIIFLAYGISITKEPDKNWNIKNPITIGQFGQNNGLNIPEKYGKSFFYKAYEPNNLNKYNIQHDLDSIIDEYYSVLHEQTLERNKNDSLLDKFINWFVENDGKQHNYFKHSFSGNRESLKKVLIQYEEIYYQEFNSKVFEFNDINKFYEILTKNLNSKSGNFFEYSAKKSSHMPRAILGKNNYLKFLEDNFLFKLDIVENITLGFYSSTTKFGLYLPQILINRFTASLLTKPFVILTGLSGSGKTKLAQAFAMWMSESKEQYALVPVGADWTNREPLLGYPNSLKEMHYVKPDSGVLDILIRANENYLCHEQDLSKCKPYFLILDEMNLSHVERYFADFLSTMESGEAIQLYSGVDRYTHFDDQDSPEEVSKVPKSLKLPKNLFIIGTVNIDETTYMFSPKVLDRANTIEFRISFDELEAYYKNRSPLNMEALQTKGKDEALSFMKLAAGDEISVDKKMHGKIFIEFFESLQLAGAEFGYRTANEMMELVTYFLKIGVELNDAYDYAIMQKLLPKLHGSRSKLNKVLPPLIELCQDKYPLSLEKLNRMKKNAEENGFASYAEA